MAQQPNLELVFNMIRLQLFLFIGDILWFKSSADCFFSVDRIVTPLPRLYCRKFARCSAWGFFPPSTSARCGGQDKKEEPRTGLVPGRQRCRRRFNASCLRCAAIPLCPQLKPRRFSGGAPNVIPPMGLPGEPDASRMLFWSHPWVRLTCLASTRGLIWARPEHRA